jgi:hypothetical protein
MYHPIVKEQVIPGQLEGLQTNVNYTDSMLLCQGEILSILEISCGNHASASFRRPGADSGCLLSVGGRAW